MKPIPRHLPTMDMLIANKLLSMEYYDQIPSTIAIQHTQIECHILYDIKNSII